MYNAGLTPPPPQQPKLPSQGPPLLEVRVYTEMARRWGSLPPCVQAIGKIVLKNTLLPDACEESISSLRKDLCKASHAQRQ